VTQRSLQAVKDMWAWSEVRKTEGEFGMFPFDRIADRMFMAHHGKRYKAARKIQVRHHRGQGRSGQVVRTPA
jgi:hypothetical protein